MPKNTNSSTIYVMSTFLRKNGAFSAFVCGLLLACLFLFSASRTSNGAPPPKAHTDTARVALGKLLFYESALSGNYKRSCSSCHRPQKAYTDQRRVSLAFQFTKNLSFNAPTLLNAGALPVYFHDGRFTKIEQIIDAVIDNPDELGCSYDTIVARLNQSDAYKIAFARAFPGQPSPLKVTINAALAAFVRSLKSDNSAFDDWKKNNYLPQSTQLSVGYQLFMIPNACGGCHQPPLFGGQIGVKRVLPLRNVAVTPPYFQNGSEINLLNAAKRCGAENSPESHRWNLEKWRAVAFFLEALTDTTTADKTEPVSLPLMPNAPRRTVGGTY